MKVLNLDTLEKEKRFLTIDGTQYPMKEMSVDDFIQLNTKLKELEEKNDLSPIVQSMEFMIENISVTFPTLSIEVLRQRSLSELNKIMEFGRGELDAQLEEAKEAAEGVGVVKKKLAPKTK